VSKRAGDQDVRDRLLGELDTTFVVEAAAGTGKTTVLVERIVRLVLEGKAKLSEIISVTFTEKAAGEMKLRLRTRLEKAREDAKDAVAQQRLTEALEELEVMRIGTIHGLCGDLLREHPVEAGVDPLFEVAAEEDAQALLNAAFHRRFQDLLEAQPEGIRRALRRKPKGLDAEPPRKTLFNAVRSLVEHRDFAEPWRRDPFARESIIDDLLKDLAGLVELLPKMKVKTGKSGDFLEAFTLAKRLLQDTAHREKVSPRDYDGLEAQLRDLGSGGFRWTSKTWGIVFLAGLTEAEALARRDAVGSALKRFTQAADADLAARLHEELRPIVEAYELEKARKGVLDFVDLLLLTRNLLQRNRAVRQTLQARFKRLFVDEFQDTDPLQSEIVLLLAADDPSVSQPFSTTPVPGKLFVVGDPKQSIYRFRRADILLYERVKKHLVSCGADVVFLSTSFRSTPGIQAAINAAFASKMVGEHQATYVALGEWREANREQPSVIALPAPRPFNAQHKVTKDAVESSLPDAIAGFVEWLVQKSGWTVEEEGKRVPVQARHVCILFKRMRRWGTDLSRQYAQALENRRVPHVLVGGRSFHLREEVMALRTALFAVDRPDDEFSVYAALKGPFFAFTDEQLFAFKHAHRKLHPLRPWDDVELSDADREVVAALGVLRELHLKRNRRPVSATVHELLELTRAHAGVAFWTAGAQALANVLQVAEVARRHERRASSFRDVVESLQEEAEDGEASEAPLVEEGTEGVRMMTVHSAKGLEFPVVILAEPSANIAPREPSHWVDPDRGLWVHSLAHCVPVELRDREAEVLERDREETLRLSYVAATRARDVLVVPVCSEKTWPDTWTEVLYPALYPQRGLEGDPKPAPGCPEFKRDPILDRDGGVPDGVPAPGLHKASTGKNGVVWWDTNVLDLRREERTGLEAADALSEDDVEGPKSIAAWESWQDQRGLSLAEGLVPTERVVVARELPPVTAIGNIAVEQTNASRERRPSGRRFGELVHACLAVVSLSATREEIARTAAVMARSLQSPEREEQAAVDAVIATLAHPLLEAARGAREVRREVALVDRLEDGTIVEGAIDLAYELDGTWQVVEFKTDENIDERRPHYEAQTLAYVRAIEAATGLRARGVILRV
jgi:ATP-dependent exoDNAse (exonuclease V) beta subunit